MLLNHVRTHSNFSYIRNYEFKWNTMFHLSV